MTDETRHRETSLDREGGESPTQSTDASRHPVEATADEHGGAAVSDDGGDDNEGTPVPVVGVGASAGGIDALKRFLKGLPNDPGAAFVVIQHLAPDHDSSLARILSGSTPLVVEQAEDGMEVLRNHVYIIPPGEGLRLRDGHLYFHHDPRDGIRSTIDTFLRSLGDALHERAACVILSGSGSDGSVGLKHVKENRGFVGVQEPGEAGYRGMPSSAIATGMVDVVATATELAQRVVGWVGSEADVTVPEADSLTGKADEAVDRILDHLSNRLGHDFQHYKRATVLRRIQRRMRVRQTSDLDAYANLIEQEETEARDLFKDLLISVTSFFRDPEAFDVLEHAVVDDLFDADSDTQDIRVWVPGCATGEEAYSLAMLLDEAARRHSGSTSIQIFATDLDSRAISVGRKGWYPEAIADDVSDARLRRYFTRDGDGYRIVDSLREMVLFAEHNLLGDPPFADVDLVSCRNLLIYLDNVAQEQVLSIFHFSLRDDGALFLGSSENVDTSRGLYRSIDEKHNIYRRRIGEKTPRLPSDLTFDRKGARSRRTSRTRDTADVAEHHREFMFDRYAPPSVVVDSDFIVRHFFGNVGKYLRPHEGLPSNSLVDLAPESARPEIRASLFQVFNEREPVGPRRTEIEVDGETRTVSVVVEPFDDDGDRDASLAVVIFEEAEDADEVSTAIEGDSEAEEVVQQLEEELRQTRARLHTVTEEFETTNEELKASNEELRSMNEELRSTTEELETRKEELQSTNEELQTVNEELEEKVSEAQEANSDLRNLMAATEIGTVFLDENLNVKRFTPAARKVFNLIEADTGRPFDHVSHQLHLDDLEGLVASVLDTQDPIEKEVSAEGGHWYLMRVLPYRDHYGDLGGVVLTTVDVTDRKAAEQEVAEQRERYRRALRHSPVVFARVNRDLTYEWIINPHSDFEVDGVIGKRDDELDEGAGVETLMDLKREAFETEEQQRDEVVFDRSDGHRTYDVTATPVREGDGDTVTGVVTASLDITDRVEAREQLRKLNDELEEKVEARTKEVRTLAKQLTHAEQRERDEIARRLHDDLQQLLYGAQMQNQMVRSEVEDASDGAELALDHVQTHVDHAAELLEKAIETSRALTVDLSPPVLDDDGLVEALQWLRSHMRDTYDLSVTLSGDGPSERLPSELRMMLFQVIRELLFNVVKHAGTDEARVDLYGEDGTVRIVVEDNGSGFDTGAVFDADENGFGLPDVKRRVEFFGGTLQVDSTPGEGTRCTITMPTDVPLR